MAQTERPLVSVAMGVCCRRPDTALLERAVDSILCQTMPDFEFLICEYGSAPAAVEYLQRAAARDKRIRLLSGRSPGTLSQNLNDCLSAARGTYIARMDDDDWSAPDRFAKQLAFLREHGEIAFVGCDARLVRSGETVGERRFPALPRVEDFYMVQPYLHPTLMFRRDALLAVGGYSEADSVLLCEDYDLLLRLYAQGAQGANLQEQLLDYTVPETARGSRRMPHRWNEAVTRYRRFRELGRLPKALPFVVKPLAVGLLPEPLLRRIKRMR